MYSFCIFELSLHCLHCCWNINISDYCITVSVWIWLWLLCLHNKCNRDWVLTWL